MNQLPRIQPRAPWACPTGLLCLTTAVVMLAGCATTTAPPGQDATPEPGAWYDGGLHWSRTAAEHRAIYEQTFRLAAERIEALAAGHAPGSWGISADADETLIDNSLYQVEIGARGEDFGPDSWNEWIERRAAPALPGAAAFTQRVQELGGIVAVVTNRRTYQCAATADNLRVVGIAYDVVLCRLEDGQKEPRFDALDAGTAAQWPEAQLKEDQDPGAVEVLMWLGDNIGDFPDLDQADRDGEGALSQFGDRYFAFPNPMYGSWEDNPKE